MSKEKQIEEMAKAIEEAMYYAGKIITEETVAFVKEHHKYHSKIDFDKAHEKSISELEAEHLYNAGYRKQSEGEWIVDAWDGEEWVIVPYIKTQHTDAFCSVCYGYALHNDKGEEIASAFCPHCGAKMKGGEE